MLSIENAPQWARLCCQRALTTLSKQQRLQNSHVRLEPAHWIGGYVKMGNRRSLRNRIFGSWRHLFMPVQYAHANRKKEREWDRGKAARYVSVICRYEGKRWRSCQWRLLLFSWVSRCCIFFRRADLKHFSNPVCFSCSARHVHGSVRSTKLMADSVFFWSRNYHSVTTLLHCMWYFAIQQRRPTPLAKITRCCSLKKSLSLLRD